VIFYEYFTCDFFAKVFAIFTRVLTCDFHRVCLVAHPYDFESVLYRASTRSTCDILRVYAIIWIWTFLWFKNNFRELFFWRQNFSSLFYDSRHALSIKITIFGQNIFLGRTFVRKYFIFTTKNLALFPRFATCSIEWDRQFFRWKKYFLDIVIFSIFESQLFFWNSVFRKCIDSADRDLH
jgi:hypothetical protein